ncbi:Uncharacterised protein [Mycobacterium tuberculosis]|nr:Uncharacterised protein [Mycobacterium tuberculosis]
MKTVKRWLWSQVRQLLLQNVVKKELPRCVKSSAEEQTQHLNVLVRRLL